MLKKSLIIIGVFILLTAVFVWLMSPKTRSNHISYEELKNSDRYAMAVFAGGCFWCMESPFEKLPGVAEVISGYSGGDKPNPTYEEVSSGTTGHRESVAVFYDPDMISYEDLLKVFWRQIDPTDAGGQFVDRGKQYSSAVFYRNEEEGRLAEESKQALAESGRFKEPVVTEIIPFKEFYPAEDYHQDYYKTHPLKYKFYRGGSGRDDFLNEKWGEERNVDVGNDRYTRPSDDDIREMLTPIQHKVTQKDGTERPYDNEYWDNKEPGIYVDIVSGEPLFSSRDKYKSGTGWPSFTRPLEPANIVERPDWGLLGRRTEVRSRFGDSHLGHVFTDGPEPTGLRYCLNSAALRFIPEDKLEEEGYGEYGELFE